MIRVETDPGSGFCPGVIRAIRTTEEYLSGNPVLYSLGDIVHNEAELERLASMGLVPLNPEAVDSLKEGDTVLVRAHGQPPSMYERLRAVGAGVIDCTCPVVLKIQNSIRAAKGSVLIFGKKGHPEVLGLMGQREGSVVFENAQELEALIASLSAPLDVFSQTTMSPVQYAEACARILEAVPGAVIHDTICSQVKTRHEDLKVFAACHDAVVFVAGKTSSNGKVLCGICRQVNIRTYHIKEPSELQKEWFRPTDCVGVCGATSTPRWLLEEVAARLEKF